MVKKFYAIIAVITLLGVIGMNLINPAPVFSKLQLAYFLFVYVMTTLISTITMALVEEYKTANKKQRVIVILTIALLIIINIISSAPALNKIQLVYILAAYLISKAVVDIIEMMKAKNNTKKTDA